MCSLISWCLYIMGKKVAVLQHDIIFLYSLFYKNSAQHLAWIAVDLALDLLQIWSVRVKLVSDLAATRLILSRYESGPAVILCLMFKLKRIYHHFKNKHFSPLYITTTQPETFDNNHKKKQLPVLYKQQVNFLFSFFVTFYIYICISYGQLLMFKASSLNSYC